MQAIVNFCNDVALKEGAGCLSLLNKAHHQDKSKISYKDVADQADHLKRLRGLIEDVHEEFRRWKWRDAAAPIANVVSLKPAHHPDFVVDIHPDLAAFTGAPSKGGSQDDANEKFDSTWFENKAFFYLKNENMGFAAPASSIVVVESEPKPGNDRNLVIALHRGEVLARRLLRPQGDALALALAAQTPDPRKSPPTRMLDPNETQIHRVLGHLNRNSYQPLWPTFREHEEKWIKRKITRRRGLAVKNVSPSQGRESHVSGDRSGTETLISNSSKETLGCVALSAHQRPANRALVSGGQEGETRRKELTSEAAQVAAERRWHTALHTRFAASPAIYEQIVLRIDPAMRCAATEAEIKQRDAGLMHILRQVQAIQLEPSELRRASDRDESF